MPHQPGRFSQLRLLQTLACLSALIGAGLLVALGIVGYGSSLSVWLTSAGAFGLFVAIMLMTITPLLLKMESTLARQLEAIHDLSEALQRAVGALDSIAENTRISDMTKSLAHREQEVDTLQRAIRDRIRNEHWEPALTLIEELERRFGQKQEAERLRVELDDVRRVAIQDKLNEAIEMVEGHFRSHEWDRAENEIDRLAHIVPDEPKVRALRDRMRALQAQHKHTLKQAWEEAVRRSDTDHAIDILRELDQYLTPTEAQSLQASARHVFKDKLLQLGIQFRFAVTEKRWQDALRTGLELVREFPNARMASEVREALDALRERARGAAESEAMDAPAKHSR